MYRFFIEKNKIYEKHILMDNEDVRHIKNVLRLNEKDKVVICDGEESEYISEIYEIETDKIIFNILDKKRSEGEPSVNIKIYQGLPKSEKMDLIVQKNTELGAKEINPIITERTIVKIKDSKKEEKKLDRWNKIARESAKQSRRGIIPKVNKIDSLRNSLSKSKNSKIIVLYESEEKISFKSVLEGENNKEISVFIGPEGGFEESEIEMIKLYGGEVVSLGKRILRTETAGFVATSILLYESNDLGVI